MSSVINAPSSSIFPLSSELPRQQVGKKNPIELPFLQVATISHTIGQKIGRGDYGIIYKVKDSQPPRIYKIISLKDFENGDEIRISQLAAQIGIAPSFQGACLVQQNKTQLGLFEMAHAGKTLSRWMEDLAIEPDVAKAALIEESATQKAREMALKELAEKKEASDLTVVTCKKVKKVRMEEAVDRLYPSRETFFFELFSALKKLAESNIAYMDSHCGNIIPNRGQGLHLIDFDAATLEKTPAQAIKKTMRGMYNHMHFKDFCSLENLSPESLDLIKWIQVQSSRALIEEFQSLSV